MLRFHSEGFEQESMSRDHICQDFFPDWASLISIYPATINEFECTVCHKFLDPCFDSLTLVLVPFLEESQVRSDCESPSGIGIQSRYNCGKGP